MEGNLLHTDSGDKVLNPLKKVALIHACESVIINHYEDDEMKTPMHMSRGDENCVVGVVEAFENESFFFGYYRSHSLYLALTSDPISFFAEMLGRETGSNCGLAGSMHLNAPEVGLLATSAIVSSTIPLSLGAGFAALKSNTKKYSVVFFGDGAIEEGVFHETLNMACLFQLPIVFVCLDNELAVDIVAKERQGFKSIESLVKGYNCEYYRLEQPDVFEAYEFALSIKSKMETHQKPVFLHMKCYRYLQHIGIESDFGKSASSFEKANYRSKQQYLEQLERLPIEKSITAALNKGYDGDLLRSLVSWANSESEQSYAEALSSSVLSPEMLPNL